MRSRMIALALAVALAGCGEHASEKPAAYVYDKKADRCFSVQPDTSLSEIECTRDIRRKGAGAQVGWGRREKAEDGTAR